MTPQTREHLLRLARKQFPLDRIAAQCSVTTATARRVIRSAESAGELPPGALKACGIRRRKQTVELPAVQAVTAKADDIRVFAPARSHAARLGRCSACNEPTDVVIQCADGQLKLCRLHVPRLADELQLAAGKAAARRNVFNKGCRT